MMDGLLVRPAAICNRIALVVDDEPHVRETVRLWLERLGWQCLCEASASGALRAVRNPHVQLAFVDYRLETGDVGVRLGRVLRRRWGLPFVLISGYLNTTIVVEAMKAGALDVIDKPLSVDKVSNALAGLPTSERKGSQINAQVNTLTRTEELLVNEIRPVTSRWARMVLKACCAREDPRTVPLWANGIGTSQGTIDEVCRLCGVRARDSRDLARFLRALALSRSKPAPLSTYLAVADERTVDGLFRRAGVPRSVRSVSLQEFLARQTFIPTSRPCLRELAHLTANSPLFF